MSEPKKENGGTVLPTALAQRVDTNFTEMASGEDGIAGSPLSMASTLYDPAVFQLSPQYKKMMEEQKNNPQPEPSKTPSGGNAETLEDDGESVESDTRGLHSSRHVSIAILSLHLCMGLIMIAVSSFWISRFSAWGPDLSSSSAMLISGPVLLGIACIIMGVVMLLSGSCGFCIKTRAVPSFGRNAKALHILWNISVPSLLFLSVGVFVLSAIGLSVVSSNPVYDESVWLSVVAENPSFACQLERNLACAGYEASHCAKNSINATINYCPGHYCVLTCRNPGAASTNRDCARCKGSEGQSQFQACLDLEGQYAGKRGCSPSVNRDLLSTYGGLVAVGIIGALWMLVVLVFFIKQSQI